MTKDVTIGLEQALGALERKLGKLPAFKYRLASSSAAGGLRMVTVGLVRELTAEAASKAALGAGAKLVGMFAYRLTAMDLKRIEELAPDIILLAGGTDGGNSEVVLHNASRLAESNVLNAPVVIACNRDVAADVAARLQSRQQAIVSENVMPSFGELNIEPAQAAIRKIFIDRIVHAKGIDRAAAMLDAVLMPTPAAVMEGAKLLARGTSRQKGLGDLVVIDIGGATTDVHSVAKGAPIRPDVVQYGLPEPYVKRTVEGDLGMRHNAEAIIEAVGIADFAERVGMSETQVRSILDEIVADVERLPHSPEEIAFDEALAWSAVRIAMARHAGRVEIVHTASGSVTVQRGKDLSAVTTVIGTGGPLAHGITPASVLRGAPADSADPFSLRPISPSLFIDADYVLYASGLLAEVEPEAAFTLAMRSLHRLE